MKVSVIGSGGWGTALALLLLENGNDVSMWSYSKKQSDILEHTRENPLLKGVLLPQELKITTELSCVIGCKAVILATPSYAVRETANKIAVYLDSGATVVLVSKGIEKDTALTLTQVVEQEIGPKFPVVALCGPSHAEEVGRGVPTAVVSASKNREAAELVQDMFMNDRFRVYVSDDVIGVEVGAAFKNVIALCAGCIDGMGYGDNTKAMLMTRGLSEIARLVVAMGGKQETVAGLAGVGDLIVTCCSVHSRNRRCGMLIGQGTPVDQALKEAGGVVEGYFAAANAKKLADKLGVEMPISQAAYEVLYENKDPRTVINELMVREKKCENEINWSIQ